MFINFKVNAARILNKPSHCWFYSKMQHSAKFALEIFQWIILMPIMDTIIKMARINTATVATFTV
jgi:hypothetical protein